jgi:drug/metabolite transporter (DMT)-like permease
MPFLVLLALLGQTLVSAGTFLIGKVTLRQFDALALAQLRFALATAGFLALMAARGELKPARMKGSWGALLGLGILGTTLNQGLFLLGLARSTPAHAALLYAATPILVLAFAWVRGDERPTARRMAGVGLAFAGVLYLLLGRGLTFDVRWLTGDALVLAAVTAWAGYTTRARPLVSRLGTLPVTGWAMALGALVFLPVGVPAVLHQDFARVTTMGWIGLVYLALVTSVLSYLLWSYALARTLASRVAVFTNLQPLLTALLAWLVLGEPLTWHFVGATACVIGGVWLAGHG